MINLCHLVVASALKLIETFWRSDKRRSKCSYANKKTNLVIVACQSGDKKHLSTDGMSTRLFN